MTEQEIASVLSIIKVAYPRFYLNITESDVKSTITLWREMFKDDDKKEVMIAVKELISELEFPPTVADIKNKIKKRQEYLELYEFAKKQEKLDKESQLMLKGGADDDV